MIVNELFESFDILTEDFYDTIPPENKVAWSKIVVVADPTLGSKPHQKKPLGFVEFPESEEDGPIYIHISTKISLVHMLDIYAHELAHILAPNDKNPHNKKWENALSKLRSRYIELIQNRDDK